MTLIQKRPYELVTYQQLAAGDVGYIDPSTLKVMVDKVGWSEPRTMSLAEFLSTHHIETATVSPTSTSFSVTYNTDFSSSSYYFAALQVYKIVAIPGVGDVRQTVKYHDLTTTISGFSFTLDTYEAGIYVTYFASEPTLNSVSFKDFMYATGSVASLVVPDSDKVQITGLTESDSEGITIASNEFTVRRTGDYFIEIKFSTLNETASNLISVDVMSDVPAALGITGNFVPRNDYDRMSVSGIVALTAADVVRFYLTAPATGLTVDLSTITVNIKQI